MRLMRRMGQLPVALTIAGSDSSAGAGIQADLKTFSALGVYGLSTVTCVVAETPGRVSRIEGLSAEMVREQIAVLLRGFSVGAIKTGMLLSGEIVAQVAAILASHQSIPIVVDPVMIATSGDALLQDDAIAIYEEELFPRAALLTPNLDEAGRLFGKRNSDVAAMAASAITPANGRNIVRLPDVRTGPFAQLAGRSAARVIDARNIIRYFT